MATALATLDLAPIERTVVQAWLASVQRPAVAHDGVPLLPEHVQEILARPRVAAALKAALRAKLTTEMAPAALAYLDELVRNERATDRARLEAAKTILDRAGFVAAQPSADNDRKALSEMSADELRSFVAGASRELSARAAPIIDGEVVAVAEEAAAEVNAELERLNAIDAAPSGRPKARLQPGWTRRSVAELRALKRQGVEK